MLRMLIRSLAAPAEPRVALDAGPRLFTIGYQDYTRRAFMAKLARLHVSVLCDLRRSATSRRAGFSGRALAVACTEAGIRYEHLWRLGIPADCRRNMSAREERLQVLEDYELRILPNQQPALEQIRDWLATGERVALMCFARDPDDCHRRCVSVAVQDALDEQVDTLEV